MGDARQCMSYSADKGAQHQVCLGRMTNCKRQLEKSHSACQFNGAINDRMSHNTFKG